MNKELTNNVSQFINKFEKKIADLDAKKILEYGSDRWSRLPVILEALKTISEGNGTLRGFSVGDTNDYGCVQNSRFVVKAYSKEHACLKAAILSGNMEWYTTGFYAAEQVDLDELIKSTKIVIKSETEKLSKLLNL